MAQYSMVRRKPRRQHRRTLRRLNRKKFKKYPLGRRIQSYGLTGVPDSMFVKMKYVDAITLSSSLSVPGFHLFRGNDIFDPDYTGVGHQPYLSAQWGPFYQKYNVFASKITVKATASKNGKILVRPTTVNTTGSDFNLAVERPESKNCFLGNDKPCLIKHYQTTRQATGTGNPDDDLFHGSMDPGGPGTGPATTWYWAIYAEDVPGTATLDIDCQVEIVYYVKLWSRRINSSS